MLNGFAGGIITVERFLARKDMWSFLGLLALISGTTLFVAGIDLGLLLVGVNVSLMLVIDSFSLSKENLFQSCYPILGILSWFIANMKFYLTGFYPGAVPFWELFILLMIISTRLRKLQENDIISLVLVSFIFGSLCFSFHGFGQVLFGFGLVGLSVRIGYLEIIHRSENLVAIALSYFWLLISGLGMVLSDAIVYSYDLVIHAFFIGFLFSMIFLNAREAFLKKFGSERIAIYPSLWIVILSVGLLVRFIGGDIMEIYHARLIGGVVNALTILGFILTVLIGLIKTKVRKQPDSRR